MKEPFKVSTVDLIDNTATVLKQYTTYHSSLVANEDNGRKFASQIPELLTPNFIAMFSSAQQGIVVKEIQTYIEGLIPTVTKEVYEDVVSDGKIVKVLAKDPSTGQVKTKKEKAFALDKQSYKEIRKLVDTYYLSASTYWECRKFVERNNNPDERLFDRMNDYLWRNVMAVYLPEDIKREFKHFCITTKRKMFYLGDRNKVFNQVTFGLYDAGIGGTGKTTLLDGLARGFSDNPYILDKWRDLFDFNLQSADKYGIVFCDEDPPTEKSSKDAVKKFIDSESRGIEGKGLEKHSMNNLFTMIISANHKIGARLFEDESRGQRRDAFFEVIGLIQQYTAQDMAHWFRVMFECCPMDNDSRTYKHRNPHSDELKDGEMMVLQGIRNNLMTFALGGEGMVVKDQFKEKSFKLGELANMLEYKSKSTEWYDLKSVLSLSKYFSVSVDHDRSKYYTPRYENIYERLADKPTLPKYNWGTDFAYNQPYIDVDAVIEELKTAEEYDCTSPIDYDKYFQNTEVK